MLSNNRILVSGQSPHPWEQEAIEFARKALPDRDPICVAELFDLVDGSGRRYDIDLLVIGRHAVYVVEIKSHPGTITGDSRDWTVTFPTGGKKILPNPLELTNYKARILASLLRKQLGNSCPYVQALCFVSDPDVKVALAGPARHGVVTRKNFLRAIDYGEFPGAPTNLTRRVIDRPMLRDLRQALQTIGIKPSVGALQVDGFRLTDLLEVTDTYQDHLGINASMRKLRRRIRTYNVPRTTTQEQRDRVARAAEREAQHLATLSDHRHILGLMGYHPEGPLGGPCVLFEHFEDAVPLDAFVRTEKERTGADLSLDDKLSLLEQIADALDYCHRKGVYHRGLHPGSILVRRGESSLQVRVYNFHLAAREGGSLGTRHISNLGPDSSVVYRAPEVIENPDAAEAASDLFSLGAIAYFLLTGRPPGTTLAERHALMAPGYLSLAVARDDLNIPAIEEQKSLEDIVAFATFINPLDRYTSAVKWVEELLAVATAPAEVPAPTFVHPLQARADQLIAADMRVEKVLGSGSSARALLVATNDGQRALKVSLSEDHDYRLEQEAKALQRLDSSRIVRLYEVRHFDGRPGLVLTYGGDSLADYLREHGPVSLDYARRWGDDLLLGVEELEQKQVQHRDIKPANVAVDDASSKRQKHLRLFDLSMTATPPDAFTAGTPAYRDPFLPARGVWDEAADRYAAAITLHEMLTGTRPRWGEDDNRCGGSVRLVPITPAVIANSENSADVQRNLWTCPIRRESSQQCAALDLSLV